MGYATLYNDCMAMGHGRCTTLYTPWVVDFCHIVWPMGHGKNVAEQCAATHSLMELVLALNAPTRVRTMALNMFALRFQPVFHVDNDHAICACPGHR